MVFLYRVGLLHRLSVSLLQSEEISGYPEVAAALSAVKGKVESAFDISAFGRYKIGRRSASSSGGRGLRRDASTKSREQLAKSAAYQKAMRKRAEQRAQIDWKAALGRSVSNAWQVRVMLADPSHTVKSLQAVCTEFNVQETRDCSLDDQLCPRRLH